MKKIFKLSAILALVALFGACGALAGCGNKENDFAVTVEFAGGIPAEGLEVTFASKDASAKATTDASGKAAVKLKGKEVEASVSYPGYGTGYAVVKKGEEGKITLSATAAAASGNGVMTAPFVLKKGEYVKIAVSKEGDNYVMFTPSEAGEYTLTTKGPYEISGTRHGISGATLGDAIEALATAPDKNIEHKWNVAPANAENIVFFKLSVKAAAYPAEFVAKVEKTGDYNQEVVGGTVVIDTSSLTVCPEPQEGFVAMDVPYTEYQNIYYNNADGYYHLGGTDGQTLYISLEKGNRYFGSEESTTLKDVFQAGNSLDLSETVSGETVRYGYTKYILTDIMGYEIDLLTGAVVDDEWDGGPTLAKLTNSDGMYPVNYDIYHFLQLYVADSGYFLSSINNDIPREANWLGFVCFYDNPANYGTEDNPNLIQLSEMDNLQMNQIEAGQVVYFKVNATEGKFVVSFLAATGFYIVFDGEEIPASEGATVDANEVFGIGSEAGGRARWRVNYYEDGSREYPFRSGGSGEAHDVSNSNSNGNFVLLTVNAEGMYTFTFSDERVCAYDESGGAYPFVRQYYGGETIRFRVGLKDANDATTSIDTVEYTYVNLGSSCRESSMLDGQGTEAEPFKLTGGSYGYETGSSFSQVKDAYYTFTAMFDSDVRLTLNENCISDGLTASVKVNGEVKATLSKEQKTALVTLKTNDVLNVTLNFGGKAGGTVLSFAIVYDVPGDGTSASPWDLSDKDSMTGMLNVAYGFATGNFSFTPKANGTYRFYSNTLSLEGGTLISARNGGGDTIFDSIVNSDMIGSGDGHTVYFDLVLSAGAQYTLFVSTGAENALFDFGWKKL